MPEFSTVEGVQLRTISGVQWFHYWCAIKQKQAMMFNTSGQISKLGT